MPRLRDIKLDGYKKLKEKELLTAVAKAKNDIISNYELSLIEKRIKKAYFEEGLQYTKVTAKMIPTLDNKYVDLEIEIDEGIKFYAKNIEFVGNTHFTSKQLANTFSDTKTKS